MQDPIFKEYNVKAFDFWKEVNSLPEKYMKEQGVKVNPDTIYLNHFLKYVREEKFKGLNNEKLRKYGEQQSFYAGIPDIFKNTISILKSDPVCEEYNIKVEHYIVSTGFAEVIRGTSIMKYVKYVWGCELIESQDEKGNRLLSEIGYTIDNTSKNRAIFEINKGIGGDIEVNVNSKMTIEQRRVDFRNMIYIADGPSDVPAFSVVKGKGDLHLRFILKVMKRHLNRWNNCEKTVALICLLKQIILKGQQRQCGYVIRLKNLQKELKKKNKQKGDS